MKNNYARLGQGFAHPKNSLPCYSTEGYALKAPAKSGVRIGVLNDCMATHDAPSVFFCAVDPSHLFSRVVVQNRSASKIMVGWVGAEKSAPESIQSGYANPAQSTTSEIGVSGGSNNRYLLEAAIMATILTPSYPQYIFVFAAIRRADTQPRICMLRTVACDERSARLSLVRDYVLSLSARLPAGEVTL